MVSKVYIKLTDSELLLNLLLILKAVFFGNLVFFDSWCMNTILDDHMIYDLRWSCCDLLLLDCCFGFSSAFRVLRITRLGYQHTDQTQSYLNNNLKAANRNMIISNRISYDHLKSYSYISYQKIPGFQKKQLSKLIVNSKEAQSP
jgi:hypothetical protein